LLQDASSVFSSTLATSPFATLSSELSTTASSATVSTGFSKTAVALPEEKPSFAFLEPATLPEFLPPSLTVWKVP
jgi:hypothetical protein